ncbi:transcription elongation factor GreB [Gammaproteobacteria bacterium]|nr:transcription elongation factor GreB [Gammaproteobacteria bacterium]
MSRYRPPAKPGAKYITKEGEGFLKEELNHLWRIERPQVTQSVSEAAALGDRSENAEYIYGKKRLREIDRRVRYLTKRLEEVQIVAQPPKNRAKIYFGAFVKLKNDQGNIASYRLVGPDEIQPKKGFISVDSPVGRALLGKQKGDEIIIGSKAEQKLYLVLKVTY